MFYALVAPGLWRLALGIISIALCGELNPQTENGSPCFENPVTLRGAFAQTQQAVSNLVESNSGAFHTPLAFVPAGESYQMANLPIWGEGCASGGLADAWRKFPDACGRLFHAWRRFWGA
jgi:hypothetical protein